MGRNLIAMKLEEFKLASSAEIKEAGWGGGGILSGSPFFGALGNLHPTIVYKIMHETFGNCNTDDVGEKSRWEWVFKTNKGLLTVYDYKWWWSIGYKGKEPGLKENLLEYAEILKAAILEKAREIKISKSQIEQAKIGGAITNPFSLFDNTCTGLLEEAERATCEIKNSSNQKGETMELTVEKYNENSHRHGNIRSLYRAAFITNYLALEGFVQLIYGIFLKKRYRDDIYKRRIENESILLKLLEADRYCEGFERPVLSPGENLFQALQYLKNVRNNFLHANIAKGMEAHLIMVDQYPILTKEKPEQKYGIRTHPSLISEVDVIRARRLVEKTVVKAINALYKEIRWKFAIVHRYWSVPYYRDSKGRVDFPLTEDDYVPPEQIEEMLSLSPDLDEDYYDTRKKTAH